MKTASIVLFIVVVAVMVALFLLGTRRRSEAQQELPPDPEAIGMLRADVLSGKFFEEESEQSQDRVVHAAAMDWATDKGVATLVAFQDGTVSLYMSGGGAILGLGEKEQVRKSAARFFEVAKSVREQLSKAEGFSYPSPRNMTFYLIETPSTLSSGPIATQDLQQGHHPLSALAGAAQDVMTEIRETSGDF